MMEPTAYEEEQGPLALAYLREFAATKQCELRFDLELEVDTGIMIHEGIRALRQASDTVESMLRHIANKIQHLKQHHQKTEKSDTNKDTTETETEQALAADSSQDSPEIQVSLRNKHSRKQIKGKRILQNLVQSDCKDLQFLICNQIFDVVINAPLVSKIQLPSVLYSGYPVQPTQLCISFADRRNCKCSWYKSADKVDWQLIGTRHKYVIENSDVGFFLKFVCVPCTDTLEGPSMEVISERKVENMKTLPTVCPFEQRHQFTLKKLGTKQIRVVTYNVLSSIYATRPNHFHYCTPLDLSIDYRKLLVGKEILGYNADIICMQEVDNSAFVSYYRKHFAAAGYASLYDRKGHRMPEGLACVFNRNRFKRLDNRLIVMSKELQGNQLFSHLWNLIKPNTDLKESFVKLLTSLQVTVLYETRTDNVLIIGNTHLFYHPEAEHIRILQAHMITTYLEHLKKQYQKAGNQNVSVILCGDFNSNPSSLVFSYMLNGKFSSNLFNQKVVKKIVAKKMNLISHRFVFESACGTPKYTNYTADFKDCLDYIFIEKNKMKVKQCVPFPKDEELEQLEGLPNEVYPSDHLALIADLEFV